MNQSTLVQIAERLESLAGKLPEKIRRPVLRELTPLKQLFLQQRRPRFLFIGSSKMPMQQIIDPIFASDREQRLNVTLTPVHRWTDWTIPGHGTISIDRHAQLHVAQMLIKSTTAICAAVGAQPIPLADMPILTSLQVLMVSGIMYISGRERSLRAATEFIAALGANVGVGMLLREGTRAMLKFFPGWGNVVCGMVAGAGTYAIGRAATAYFLEGASLKEAKQTYLKSRRKRSHRALPSHE